MNKRKKLARQVAAKTGVSYQGAINQLNKEKPACPKITFAELGYDNDLGDDNGCLNNGTPIPCLSQYSGVAIITNVEPQDDTVQIPIVKLSIENARQLVCDIQDGKLPYQHALFLWRVAGDRDCLGLDVAVAFIPESDRPTHRPYWLINPPELGERLWFNGEWPMYEVIAINTVLGTWMGKTDYGTTVKFRCSELKHWKREPASPRVPTCSCGPGSRCLDCCHEGNGKPIEYWRQKHNAPRFTSKYAWPKDIVAILPGPIDISLEDAEVNRQWIETGLLPADYVDNLVSECSEITKTTCLSYSNLLDYVIAADSDPDPKAAHHVGPPDDLVSFIGKFPDAVLADKPKHMLLGAVANVDGHPVYCYTQFTKLITANPSVKKQYYDWRSKLAK